jgi:HAD superfamily hydrolase (TIGR01509 family)
MLGPPVVFDCDGLLLETEIGWSRAESTLFGRYGRDYGADDKRLTIGKSLPEAARIFAGILPAAPPPDQLLQELIDLALAEFEQGVQPMPGAIDLVEELHGTRPLAVATNSFRTILEVALDRSGLRERFDVLVAGDEVPNPKPAPDIYLEACLRLAVDPSDAVALEDSPSGVSAAKSAGLFVIGVPYLKDLPLEGVDLVAPSLDHPAVRSALRVGT